MHSSAFSDLNQIAAEQNEKVLQCDSTCKQDKKTPPHRFFTGCPRSERKYFTAVQLPAGLRFIILYLIPFISSTFSRVIRLPVLHICLHKHAGDSLRIPFEASAFSHCGNSNRQESSLWSGRTSARLIYAECGLCFYPHEERLQ